MNESSINMRTMSVIGKPKHSFSYYRRRIIWKEYFNSILDKGVSVCNKPQLQINTSIWLYTTASIWKWYNVSIFENLMWDSNQAKTFTMISLGQNLIINLYFYLSAILSTSDEQSSWKANNNIPHDRLAIHNALFMRTCCIGRQRQWPLLIDPDDQVMTWVKLLQERGVVSFHEGLALEEGAGKIICHFNVSFKFVVWIMRAVDCQQH